MDRFNIRCAGRHCTTLPSRYCECNNTVTYFCELHTGSERKGHRNCKLHDAYKDISGSRQEIFAEIRSRLQSIDSSEAQIIKATHRVTELTRAKSSDIIMRCKVSRNTFQDLYVSLRSTPYIFHKDLDLIRSNPNSIPGVTEAKELEDQFRKAEISTDSDMQPPDNMNLTCFKIKHASMLQEKKIKFLRDLSSNLGTDEITAVAAKPSQNLIIYGTKNSKIYLIKQNTNRSGLTIEDSGRDNVRDNGVKAITITKDAREALIGFQKGEILVYKILERIFITLYQGNARICSLSSSEGNIAALDFTSSTTIFLKNGQSFKIKGENDNKRENVLKFTYDGRYVITSNKFRNVVRFSLIDNSQNDLLESESEVTIIEVSKVQPFVAICYSKTIEVINYSVSTKQEPILKHRMKREIAMVSFTKKNKNLCFIGYSKGIKQFDLKSKQAAKIKTVTDLACYIECFPELKKFTCLFQS